jgi:hypothetical protein
MALFELNCRKSKWKKRVNDRRRRRNFHAFPTFVHATDYTPIESASLLHRDALPTPHEINLFIYLQQMPSVVSNPSYTATAMAPFSFFSSGFRLAPIALNGQLRAVFAATPT